jgi:hypothetical protein
MSGKPPTTFMPRMDILSASQRHLWQQLRPVPKLGWVLYGGTAIALRLGHRTSVDFDFFSERPLQRDSLLAHLGFLDRATTLQDAPDTWSVSVAGDHGDAVPVKVSFFGGLGFGRVGTPQRTADGVLQVASSSDLLATKLKVLLQRVEGKDYRDIAALLSAGADLAAGLASAREMYGQTFQPSESLKALVYFQGGDLHTLTTAERTTLIHAVREVRELPRVSIQSRQLAASSQVGVKGNLPDLSGRNCP